MSSPNRIVSKVLKDDRQYALSLSAYAEQTEEWQTRSYFAERETIPLRISYTNLSRAPQQPNLRVELPDQLVYNGNGLQIQDRSETIVEAVSSGGRLFLPLGIDFECAAGHQIDVEFMVRLNTERLSRQVISLPIYAYSRVETTAMQHFAQLTIFAKAPRPRP